MTSVQKKEKGLLRRKGLKYFRFTTDLQTPLDLKVCVDNHLKAIETEQSGTFSSKFSKYILLFFNFYVTPNFARVYEIRISSLKNIQERDDSAVSLATLNCETFIYKKVIQEQETN